MFKKILNRAAGVSMALVLVAGVFAGCSDAFSASTDEAVNERAVFIEEGDRIYAVAESQPSDRLQFKLDLGSTSLSAGDEFTFYITYNKTMSSQPEQNLRSATEQTATQSGRLL